MYDFEIAFFLYKMAKIQSIFLGSQYSSKAYFAAGMSVDAYDTYIEDMYDRAALREIPYVGVKIEACIIEIIETGKLQELRDYEEMFSISDYSLLLSSGLSDSIIRKLWGISVARADALLEPHCLNKIRDDFSKGDFDKIVRFAESYRRNQGAYLLSYGRCLAEELRVFLESGKGIAGTSIIGEIAAACEKIRSIEIEVYTAKELSFLKRRLGKYSRVHHLHCIGDMQLTGETVFGIPFSVYLMGEGDMHGGKAPYDPGFAVKGDLHTHTSQTDGIHSLVQMAEAAQKRGYEYLAITDHTVTMKMAHGLSENEALSQIEDIRKYNEKSDIKILAGIEVDIKGDGSLDFCDEVLSQFDFVVAAIHTQLGQAPMVLYNRLEKALSNPYVNILAHPTGRLLGRPGVLFSERAPVELGIDQIVELCRINHVVMEVNCFPERLDLSMEHIKLAVEKGVRISLGTDAHSLAHLCNIEYGLQMIKHVQVPEAMVLNTLTYEGLTDFFDNQREKPKAISQKAVTQSKKDFSYYFGNDPEIMQGIKTVVGIDLTGSEDKPSGWAYLRGTHVQCVRIGTDQEILESVERTHPDLISIDSPLAYPRGRCCADKNCECRKYGIMRESERLLRHFGITVYPCLIDSMVKLTTRGMRLAKMLREKGYRVIESYPGVAQDILMIPRKGKTKEQFEHLKRGLSSFGIAGDLLLHHDISHDEVDAITSALVGYFYMNNQYVGLGNEEEDYLIVPRIQEDLLQKRVIIGLSGETGAGKTTITEYLRFKYGLQSFRYSKVIQEIYDINDDEKEKLQQIGSQIAADEVRQRELSQYMIGKMNPGVSCVVDGLRHPEDYEELKKHFGDDFIFLYINCSYANRYKRYNKLHFNEIPPAKFKEINNHISEIDITKLLPRADFQINNNKGFTDLREQIDDIVTGKK